MKVRSAVSGLALALGMTLPVGAAEPPADMTLAQAPSDAPGPDPGAHPRWGHHG